MRAFSLLLALLGIQGPTGHRRSNSSGPVLEAKRASFALSPCLVAFARGKMDERKKETDQRKQAYGRWFARFLPFPRGEIFFPSSTPQLPAVGNWNHHIVPLSTRASLSQSWPQSSSGHSETSPHRPSCSLSTQSRLRYPAHARGPKDSILFPRSPLPRQTLATSGWSGPTASCLFYRAYQLIRGSLRDPSRPHMLASSRGPSLSPAPSHRRKSSQPEQRDEA